ncbi:MAG: hypothetical protein ABDH61_01725 [Acidilobaceae archaeon]
MRVLLRWGSGSVGASLAGRLLLEFRNLRVSIEPSSLTVSRALEIREYVIGKRRYVYLELPTLEPLEQKSSQRRAELGAFEVKSTKAGPLDFLVVRPLYRSPIQLIVIGRERLMLEAPQGREVSPVIEGGGEVRLVVL